MPRGKNKVELARIDVAIAMSYGTFNISDPTNIVATAPCVWCGIELDLTSDRTKYTRQDGSIGFTQYQRDRVNPGGDYSYSNVMPSCSECNNDRGNNDKGPDNVNPLYTVNPNITPPPREYVNMFLGAKAIELKLNTADAATRRQLVRQSAINFNSATV